MYGNRKITVVPLTSRQVHKDQVRLSEEYKLECELRKKEKNEEGQLESLAKNGEDRNALVCLAKGVNKARKHSLFTNIFATSFLSFFCRLSKRPWTCMLGI